MPVTITRTARGYFAVAAALALALSACSPSGGSNESPSSSSAAARSSSASGSSTKAASPTSPSASPTPIAASSEGPAKNWPVPKMPPAAKKHSPEGAKAFTEYYFELINYAEWTNDASPLKAVSSRSCEGCGEIIDAADGNAKVGAWAAGGERTVSVYSSRLVEDTPSASINFGFDQERMTFYNPDGSKYGDLPKTKKAVQGSISLIFDRRWKATTLSFVDS